MSQPEYKCIKCGFTSNRGFLTEYSEGSHFVVKWQEGEPVNRQFLGLKGQNIETDGRRRFDVRSMRCERCGYLELYAV